MPRRQGSLATELASTSNNRRQQTAKRSSELGVEDCVDDWVEETVDVSEPDEEREDEEEEEEEEEIPGDTRRNEKRAG